MNNAFFGKKIQEIWENTEMLNLQQQEAEKNIWCQNQIIILKSFSQRIY